LFRIYTQRLGVVLERERHELDAIGDVIRNVPKRPVAYCRRNVDATRRALAPDDASSGDDAHVCDIGETNHRSAIRLRLPLVTEPAGCLRNTYHRCSCALQLAGAWDRLLLTLDCEVAHVIDAVARFRATPNHHVENFLVLEQRTDRNAADYRRGGPAHITRFQAVLGRAIDIHLDLDRRLFNLQLNLR